MPRPDFAQRLASPVPGHVLVAGAGGIGCPAAWALRASGVARITLVDPDVVELSNLPRQVLYTTSDVGRPKAAVAAQALGGRDAGVAGVHARLDEETATRLLEDVDVLVDATDGARTKDWVNQLAVRRGLPLVHAAGLRSEGRLLPVPAGGRPCLACLFGRLEAETGSCADLGVWNGVVGTVGFLAAHVAIQVLEGRAPVPAAYTVLDFEAASGFALEVRTAEGCPICAGSPRPVEAYPAEAQCDLPDAPGRAVDVPPDGSLDLRTERCPMNLLRARKALEQAPPGHVLDIELGAEGAATVPDGVRALGHDVLREEPREAGLRLLVRRGRVRGEASVFDDDALRRFARQLVLPEVGERGQQRLCDHAERVAGEPGIARDVAVTYLCAAGVRAEGVARSDGPQAFVLPSDAAPVAVQMARAAAWADALERGIVRGAEIVAPLEITVDGRV